MHSIRGSLVPLGTRRAVCRSELCWFPKIWRGFENFQLFVGFWMKKLLYFQYKCSLKKVVIFTVSKLAFLCGFPARRRYQIRKLEGFSFSLHVGTSPNSKQRKSYSCSKLANRMKNGPENGAFQNLKKPYKILQNLTNISVVHF